MIKKYIPRNYYLKLVKPYINTNLIKVIVGQRRVGKSYFLYQIMDEVRKKKPKANIIYLNKELYEFDFIKDYHHLNAYIDKRSLFKKQNYLFIDEIQEINQFEKSLRDFAARGNFDIYATGSNARLLSSDLANSLGGRFIEVPIYTLSYREFLDFHHLPNTKDSLFLYVRYGGMPYLVNLKLEEEPVYGYLKTIYNTIILKDVVARFNTRQVYLLEKLVEYLANNVGSLISAKKISDFLQSQHLNISPNSILNYLNYLTSSFFIHQVKRQDVMGKKIFEINEKYYFEDIGIRHALIGYRQIDINKIMENLVYSQLKFLGYKVNVGQFDNREIDFVAEKDNKKCYYQVVYLLTSKKVIEREFDSLLRIKNNYPKYVVSLDEKAFGDYHGIKHIGLADFLMS
jgi:predicted AAA+ superfamily ATPase